MNTKTKLILCFSASAVIGAFAGAAGMYFGMKKKMEEKSKAEIEWIRGYYVDKVEEVDKIRQSLMDAINATNEKAVDKSAEETARKTKPINYHDIYVPKTGDVTQKEIAAETNRASMIEIIDITEYGNDENFEQENAPWKFYRTQNELYDSTELNVVNPVERFGEYAYNVMKTTRASTIYIRDHSINLEMEVDIIDD